MPKSIATKLNGASVQKGWSISKSINIVVRLHPLSGGCPHDWGSFLRQLTAAIMGSSMATRQTRPHVITEVSGASSDWPTFLLKPIYMHCCGSDLDPFAFIYSYLAFGSCFSKSLTHTDIELPGPGTRHHVSHVTWGQCGVLQEVDLTHRLEVFGILRRDVQSLDIQQCTLFLLENLAIYCICLAFTVFFFSNTHL